MLTAIVRLGAVLALAAGMMTADRSLADAPKSSARTDLHGDPLPPGAIARLGSLRLVQGGRAYHIAASPDGKLLAAGDEHGKLRLWDVASGRERRVLDAGAFISSLAFVPGSRGLRIAVGTSVGRLCIWDVTNGKIVLDTSLPGPKNGAHGPPLGALAASPDGTRLVVGADDGIFLWDLSTGKNLRRWTAHAGGALSLRFTPDGKGLLSGGRAHEIIGGSIRLRTTRPNDDYALALWDVASGRLRKKFAEQHSEVRLTGTSAGRSWGSVGYGKDGLEFRLWDDDLRTRTVVSLKGLKHSIQDAALAPDGKTLAITGGRAILLFDVATSKTRARLTVEGEYLPLALAFLPDGKILAASSTNTRLHLWNLDTNRPRHTFDAHTRAVRALSVAPDGKTAATGGEDGQVRVWEIATGKSQCILTPPQPAPAYLVALRHASDGKALAAAYFGGITLWDAAGRRLRTISAPPNGHRIASMHLSPDGNRLAFQGIDDDVVRLWDLRVGKEIRRLPQGNGGTYYLAYSPRDEVIASTVTNRLSLWDADTGRELYRKPLSAHKLTFSPDGLLLGAYSEPMRILEAGSGEELARIPHRVSHGGSWSLAFSPDGRFLAVTEKNDVGIWDVLAGRFVHTFRGHRAWTTAVAFTPDGTRLLSAAEDTTALVWDTDAIPRIELPSPKWESMWDTLAAPNRLAAYTAFWHLRREPARAVALLEKRLRPVPAVEPARLERLLKELDAPTYATRERAVAELRGIADVDHVAKRLRQYLGGPLSLEARRRLERRVLPGPGGTLETRRLLWCVRLLELIGTDDARLLLRRMTDGTQGSPVTRQAQAALAQQKSK